MGNLALSLVLEEVNRACASHRRHAVGPQQPRRLADHPAWHRGAEEGVAAPARERRADRRLLPDRGQRRLGRPASLRTTAREDGDEWVLDGTKLWVTNGRSGRALRRLRPLPSPTPSKSRGISAFLVPRDTPGLTVGKHEMKTGIRGLVHHRDRPGELPDPEDEPPRRAGQGLPTSPWTRWTAGASASQPRRSGSGVPASRASTKYSKERSQFGKPIGEFQAIQWKLADMSARIDAARLKTWRAAWLRDRGEPCTQASAEAKLLASTTANFAADECVPDPRRRGVHRRLPRRAAVPRRAHHRDLRGRDRHPAPGHRAQRPGLSRSCAAPRRSPRGSRRASGLALARMISLGRGRRPALPRGAGAHLPPRRPRLADRRHRPAGRGEEHARQRARQAPPRGRGHGRHPRHRSVEPLLRGRAARRPHPDGGSATADPGVFIRSMASRGSHGGLARAAVDACDAMDAFGFDHVLVETVGVRTGGVRRRRGLRHDGRGPLPGRRGRHPGHEGGDPRGGRRPRGEQGRPPGGGPADARPERDGPHARDPPGGARRRVDRAGGGHLRGQGARGWTPSARRCAPTAPSSRRATWRTSGSRSASGRCGAWWTSVSTKSCGRPAGGGNARNPP